MALWLMRSVALAVVEHFLEHISAVQAFRLNRRRRPCEGLYLNGRQFRERRGDWIAARILVAVMALRLMAALLLIAWPLLESVGGESILRLRNRRDLQGRPHWHW